MKATVHKINNGSIWCVCPQQEGDLFFGMIDVDYNYIKSMLFLYIIIILLIKFYNNLKENQIIDGNLIRENRKIYFVPRDAKYSSKEEINSEPVKTRYAVTAIKAIMGNEKQRPITIEQFEYIKSIAYREGSIRTFVSNGFSVDKFLIYGKLGANKQILYPRIKIIH